MFVPFKYGSRALSRIASPTLYNTSSRAFSISVALRQGSNDSNRINPIIGDIVVPPKPAKPIPPKPSFTAPPPPPPPASASDASSPKADQSSSPSSSFPYNAADSTSDPFSTLDIADLIAEKAASYGQSLGLSDPLARPKVRTKAVAGRTVFIKNNLSAQSAPTPVVAIRVLERLVRTQKVKTKFHSQKFHERKGLKKKRLRSERWRARFKMGFKAAVSKVMELKRQGW